MIPGWIKALGWLTALAAAAIALLGKPHFNARVRGYAMHCYSNLKNVATAMEMYAADNEKIYPVTLNQLTPAYLKQLPRCPRAQNVDYWYTLKGRHYRLGCKADHVHWAFWKDELNYAPGYPQYDSDAGVIYSPRWEPTPTPTP